MRPRIVRLWLIATLSCVTVAAGAENPFAGTWKIDYSKSQLTGGTITFTPESNGAIRVTEDGQSYSFKPDGSDATNAYGQSVQWTKVDDHNWKSVTKNGSTVLNDDAWTVSDDGKTLNLVATGTKPNGDPINESETFTRIASGNGIIGKWKSTQYSNSNPTTRQIEANGNNGIIWKIPEMKATLNLNFDGQDVAPVGPTVPEGLTIAAVKTGPRGFLLTEKMKGKVIFKARYYVSADGQTMIEKGEVPGVKEPETHIFQKS